MSSFFEGQKVVCISNIFPVKATTEQDKSIIGVQPDFCPQVGETLVIDEMMGDEWLRFNKYDTDASYNWWHTTRFRPLDEFEITASIEESKITTPCTP